jgi:hypothetical protein
MAVAHAARVFLDITLLLLLTELHMATAWTGPHQSDQVCERFGERNADVRCSVAQRQQEVNPSPR